MDIISYIRSRLIVKNSLLNFGSQGLLILLAFYCLPILVTSLTPENFGLLTLVWAVVGYFSVFDLGISRAVTKYLSEIKLGNDQRKINQLIWSAIISGLVVGMCGMVILYLGSIAIIPYFNNEFISSESVITIVQSASIGIPFIVVFGIIKGIQSAYHRFDFVNGYQFILGTIQWVGSVIIVQYGFGVYEIVLLTVVTRAIVTLAAFFQLPSIVKEYSLFNIAIDRDSIQNLFRFGSWLTISQFLSPVFLYIDRFFIGIFLTISAVGYYSLAQEALNRLLIIPMSVSMAMYPIVSEYVSIADSEKKMSLLYDKSLFYLTLILAPLFSFAALFSYEILTLWVGSTIATGTSQVFTILSIGYFFNSLAQIPATFLHSQNKPKITAILHIIELPIAVGLSVLAIYHYGISGAAFVWSLRALVDCLLLLSIAKKSISQSYSFRFTKNLFFILAPLIAVMMISISISFFKDSFIKIVVFIPLTIIMMFLFFRSGTFQLERMQQKNY